MAASKELTAADQARLVQALGARLAPPGQAPARHIETHISHVLLAGGHAYKIKKALATSFLDQSTLALRRHACDEELRLNRRFAPELYLDVVPITGTPADPHLGGPGAAIEFVVRMRAFDEAGLWDRLARRGELQAADVDELAAVLARFHAAAAAAPSRGWLGSPGQVRAPLLDSLRDLRAAPLDAASAAVERIAGWEAAAFARLAPTLAHRQATGRVRECHGDLHLSNVARERGRVLVFDGIEFNDEFRWLDVMSEVAFMAMDLHAHRLAALAHRFVDAYLHASGDYGGLRVFDYYLVHRALVRAKVARLRAAQAAGAAASGAAAAPAGAAASPLVEAGRYLELALHFTQARPRALIITHGLSGSGKTTGTQSLLEQAGAVRVRADVERKRLAGLDPLQRSGSAPGAGLYSAQMNEATETRLFEAASAVLEGGWPVIVDATFQRRAARAAARQCAAALGVPFFILRFAAPPEVLRERVRRRAAAGCDASEADEAVLEQQLRTWEPLAAEEMAAAFEAPPAAADWTPLLARIAAAASAPLPAERG